MAKYQTRRAISVNGELYESSMDLAIRLGVPLSSLTEHGLRLVAQIELSAQDIRVASIERRREAALRAVRNIRVPVPRPASISRRAADYCAKRGCTLQEAADQFGLIWQAVHQAINRKGG